MNFRFSFLVLLGIIPSLLKAQNNLGFEGIYVERYYVATAEDAEYTKSTERPTEKLEEGAVTYRVYVDLEPGYVLQAVFGNQEHPLHIETSTYFYNELQNGDRSSDRIKKENLKNGLCILDSWIGSGGVSDSLIGIPRQFDKDGVIWSDKGFKKSKLLKARDENGELFFSEADEQ